MHDLLQITNDMYHLHTHLWLFRYSASSINILRESVTLRTLSHSHVWVVLCNVCVCVFCSWSIKTFSHFYELRDMRKVTHKPNGHHHRFEWNDFEKGSCSRFMRQSEIQWSASELSVVGLCKHVCVCVLGSCYMLYALKMKINESFRSKEHCCKTYRWSIICWKFCWICK